MPRVRCFMSVPVLCIILVHALFGIDIVTADCWYDNEKHEEGVEVATTEPCLNCTCNRGALLCYLRVCPRLPNPPPPGCILLHRYRSCCPELICSEMPSGKGIEGRSEPDPMDLEHEKLNLTNACMSNGSIYAPGSAMDSSTQCKYCYCLGGQQRCVKPKCLLPLDGCIAAYDSNECCPARYNCTKNIFTSTTTNAPDNYESKGGCIIGGTFYQEGGKVLGVGHSICDNCYCLRGLVRCEPLSCAPPLLGCTPVIKAGECCAASYNCSGTIETQPEPNYGQFPTVSKDYAKLRKEVQHKRTTSKFTSDVNRNISRQTNVPYYVLAETTKPQKNQPTTRQYTQNYFGTITQSPFYYNLTNIETQNHINKRNDTYPEIYYVSTKVLKSTTYEPKNVLDDLEETSTTVRHKKYTVLKFDDTIEGRINRRIDNQNKTALIETVTDTIELETDVPTSTLPTTDLTEESTTIEFTTMIFNSTDETTDADVLLNETSTTDGDITSTTDFTIQDIDIATIRPQSASITVTTVINTTDCNPKPNLTVVDVQYPAEHRISDEVELNTSTQMSADVETTTIFDETTGVIDVTEIGSEGKMQSATINPKLSSEEMDDGLNKTKEHFYDYDYNAPTLPPSLPNLRIIPFVAADALDSKKTNLKNNNIFPQDRVSDANFPFNNLFSPPDKTEGGFVPKEPSILNIFYDSNYHTTNIGTNTETSLPVPAITNPPKSDENNCMVDTKEITHGESVASEGTCALCICYYGSIVCHEPQCSIPRKGCRNSNSIDRSTCCPHLICDDEESPTVVLDRLEGTLKSPEVVTIADAAALPDPFRDVIRTETAPNLQSLMGDMSNFLSKQTTTAPTTLKPIEISITNNTTLNETTPDDDDSFSLDKVWQLLFSSDLPETTTTVAPPIVEKHVLVTDVPRTTTQPPAVTSTAQMLNLEIRTANHNLLETRENINDNLVNKQANNMDHIGAGLLKLAGCNIYGRMYRVGRIISELSGPCLECKCTEVGVQCEALSC